MHSATCRVGASTNAAVTGSTWNITVPMVWLMLKTEKRSAALIAPAKTSATLPTGIDSAIHGSARVTSFSSASGACVAQWK
ncbi:hypothetical protein D3C87_1430180 [compost metagenome]